MAGCCPFLPLPALVCAPGVRSCVGCDLALPSGLSRAVSARPRLRPISLPSLPPGSGSPPSPGGSLSPFSPLVGLAQHGGGLLRLACQGGSIIAYVRAIVKPFIPILSQSFAFRIWDISTPCAGDAGQLPTICARITASAADRSFRVPLFPIISESYYFLLLPSF